MRKIRRSEKGATLVEVALSLTVLMFTIFWMLEMMLMIYAYNVMADAAKEGVRYAIVRGSISGTPLPVPPPGSCYTNSGAVYTQVQQFANLSLHSMSGMTVNVCYLDNSNKPPSRVQVNIKYPLVPYFAFSSLPTVNAQAQGNIVY